MTSSLIGRQAVVVGAGMAGLPAACVRSDYFEHVTVLERGRRFGLAQ
jgi:phytoene dehydrogenase-like protein